jgi:hypothetical protein
LGFLEEIDNTIVDEKIGIAINKWVFTIRPILGAAPLILFSKKKVLFIHLIVSFCKFNFAIEFSPLGIIFVHRITYLWC